MAMRLIGRNISMPRGRSLLAISLAAGLGAFAVLSLVVLLRSSATPTSSSVLATNTLDATVVQATAPYIPIGALPVNSSADAVNVAACEVFTGGPGPNTSNPQSLAYVEATFGEARSVLPFSANAFTGAAEPDFPDDTPVFVIVAYGAFPESHVVGEARTPRVFSSVWSLFVKGELGTRHLTGFGTQEYDLAKLGNVHAVDDLPPVCSGPILVDENGTPVSSSTPEPPSAQ
jgi:hypothetical protein